MAIDSPLKRRSISGIPGLLPGVTPDATAIPVWRQAASWSYSGILVQQVAIVDRVLTADDLARLISGNVTTLEIPFSTYYLSVGTDTVCIEI